MATKSQGERPKRFETTSGIDLPADFNPTNTEPVDYDKDLNSPGDFPYTAPPDSPWHSISPRKLVLTRTIRWPRVKSAKSA
jgi:hypothetical protein